MSKSISHSYNVLWETNPTFSPWVSRSSKGDGFVFCKVCHVNISSKNGLTDLKRHSGTKNHKFSFNRSMRHLKNDLPLNRTSTNLDLKHKGDEDYFLSDEDKYFYKYVPKWESLPSFSEWLKPSNLGKSYAFCKVCNSHLLIGNKGKFGLLLHEKGNNHQLRLEEARSSSNKIKVLDISARKRELYRKQLEENGELLSESMPIIGSLHNNMRASKGKKRQYQYIFNPLWELDPCFSSWVMPSTSSNTSAFCKLCSVELDVGSSGKMALEQHAKGKKHMEHCSPPRISNYASPCEKAKITVEKVNLDAELEDSSSNDEVVKSTVSTSNIERKQKEGPTAKVRKKRYLRIYRSKWEREAPFKLWLNPSSKGTNYAYCKACKKHLVIGFRGKGDLQTHSKAQKHLKHLEVLCGKPRGTYISKNNYLTNSIRRILPQLDTHLIPKVYNFIVHEIGAEVKDDLLHVEVSDFANLLKPVQARKLVDAWHQECRKATNLNQAAHKPITEDSLNHQSKERTSGFVPLIDLAENDTCTMTIQLNSEDLDVPEKNTHTVAKLPEHSARTAGRQPDSRNHPNLPPLNPLNMPSISSFADDCPTSSPSSTVKPQTSLDIRAGVRRAHPWLKRREITDDELQRRLKKGEWVEHFSIPSENLSPDLLNDLNTVERLREPKLGMLIRILADNIYAIIQNPHIDDLRAISERITLEFACLQDPVGSSVSTFHTVFIKLRNRIYTLRKEKSRLLRKEQKKMEKTAQSGRGTAPPKNLRNSIIRSEVG